MENKSSGGIKSSVKYEEEPIGEGDPTILRGQNDNKQGRIFPTVEEDNKMKLRRGDSEEGEE